MMGRRVSITVPPGINKDDTSYTATQYTDADKIRFYRGYPQKIGGWLDITQDTFGGTSLVGIPRSIYTFRDVGTGQEVTLIGTDQTLYALTADPDTENGYVATNITPIGSITQNPGAGTLTTFFYVGINNPIRTISGSNIVTMTFTTSPGTDMRVGDSVNISGVTGPVGGIDASSINGEQWVDSIAGPAITFLVNETATADATGGGATTGAGSQTVRITQNPTYLDGQRMRVSGAVLTRGISAANLNIEAIVRNVVLNTSFDYESEGYATSAGASSGDNIVTTLQVANYGYCDAGAAVGYGGGYYGVGEYGLGAIFYDNNLTWQQPTIWSFDRMGTNIVMTAGNQTPVYTWDGNIDVAPIVLSGAPPHVNYVFVMGNQVAVLGPTTDGLNGSPSKLQTSASFQPTVWGDATTDQYNIAFQGASQLSTAAFVQDQYLIFTENNVLRLQFTGLPTWTPSDLYLVDGVLGPKCVVSVANFVYWVGNENFYYYDGATVRVLPNNTVRQWFYDNLNIPQAHKCFLWQNLTFNEVWLFFPSGGSSECNTYIIWNFEEGHFTNGMLSRTAGENYTNITRDQFMANGSCNSSVPNVLYLQEIARNYTNNGNPMVGHLITNDALLEGGQNILQIERIIPSSNIIPIDTGNLGQLLYNITVYTKEYDGQQMQRRFGPMNVYDSTTKLEIRANGRQWQYEYRFNNDPTAPGYPSNVGFRIGEFFAEIKPVTPR